ncbi:MAG: site-2 protease family protein [Acidobacteria bacterium]|nr:site-2 protease family protein [Acidobacteriota bacterium]
MNDATPQGKTWLNGLLFVLTILSTCFAGLGWSVSYLFFESGANPIVEAGRALSDPRVFPLSALYAAVLMIILVGHELGHYLTCRRYGVAATLPFFIPGPPFIGTFGAFIRTRSPINFKRQLFDIGANGPLAGFFLALPALVVGLAFSRVTAYVPTADSYTFGEPLLFRILSALFFGKVSEGSVLVLHPVGFAGWIGLLVTAINLVPLGQLDGGHIAYALLGRKARLVSKGVVAIFIVMGVFFWIGWFLWAAVILFFEFKSKLRLRHPPVLDEDVPLDPKRRFLSVLIVVIFILSFIPDPVKGFDLLSLFKGLAGGGQ